jgi:hypothetical protein
MTGYTYDMSIYLGNDRQHATHATVTSLTRRVEEVEYI